MYDCEYEEEILTLLRILKFLHLRDNAIDFGTLFCGVELDMDNLYELADCALWELFEDMASGSDEEDETEYILASDPLIERNLALCNEWYGITTGIADVGKLRDCAEWFLSGLLWDYSGVVNGDGYFLKLSLSPEYYDSLVLGSAMVDMLLFFQQENTRLEAMLRHRADQSIQLLPACRREAA